MCSYVDNIVVAGHDASSVRAILSQVEGRLRTRWELSLPESSVEVLAPCGAPVSVGDPLPLQHTKLLGHLISADGSVSTCWAKTQGTARSALWRHIRAARQARLSASARLKIVDQFVWPIIAYRVPAWPPTEWLRKRMNTLQRWCAAQAMSIARFPGEALSQFSRRRARIAGFEARRMGLLSDRAIVLVCRFREQLVSEARPTS